MSGKYQLVAHIHPFAPAKRIAEERDVGASIEEIVDGLKIATGNVKAFVDGTEIMREQWIHARPADGQHVLVRAIPAGSSPQEAAGGAKMVGGGAMFITGMLLTATGVGGPLGAWMMYSGAAMFGLGLATFAGAFGFMFPEVDVSGIKQTPSLRGGANQQPQKYTKIPVVFGKHLVVPYHAARPYTTIDGADGEDQYLIQMFCIGSGPLKVTDLKIGENELATNLAAVRNGAITVDGNYEGVDIQIYQDGTNPSIYPYAVLQDNPGIQLDKNVEHWLTTAEDVDRVSVDITFPSGIYRYDGDGDKKSTHVVVEVRRRAVGSGTAWASCTLVGTFDLDKKVSKTVRYSIATDLTKGQYEFGMMRTDAPASKGSDTPYWSEFRSIRKWAAPVDASVRSKYVFLAIKIKASKQLNGALNTLNCVCEAEYPAYDGSGTGSANWVNAFSQNPAAAFLWAMRGSVNPRPIADADIDWPRIEEWYTHCASKGWTCNAVISQTMRLKDLLDAIASTGRAKLVMRDGKYSVVCDKPVSTVVQHFTPRNVRNFAWSKSFESLPYGLKCSYIRESDGWDEAERVVPYDEYTAAEAEANLQKVSLFGITSASLVWKHARFRMAVAKLRPEVWSFETDPEGMVCEVGDLVLVAHDAILVGLHSGRVKAVSVDGSDNVTAVQVDEQITMEAGKTYGMRFWRNDGTSVLGSVTTSAGEGVVVAFSTPIPAATAPAVGDLFTFGESGIETKRAIVAGYEMLEDFAVRIYCVDEAPSVHTADSGTIPDYVSGVSRPPKDNTVDTDVDNALAELKDLALASTDVTGSPSEIPADIVSITAVAARDQVNLDIVINQATNVRTAPVGIIIQRSKDSGVTWYDSTGAVDGLAPVAVGPYAWKFDRTADGYPEASGLATWQFRAKAINVSGVMSTNWTYDTLVDTTGYLTWIPPKLTAITVSSAQRAVTIRHEEPVMYGLTRYEWQISKDGTTWYAPGCPSGQTPYTSEDNWRVSGTVGADTDYTVAQWTQSLPLTGQASGLPVNTTYYYRVRAVSLSGAIGTWSDTITAVVTATAAADIVESAINTSKLAYNALAKPKNVAAYWAMDNMPEYPDDAAGVTYFQDAWANADGWSVVRATADYTTTPGSIRLISTGLNPAISKAFAGWKGKKVIAKCKKVSGGGESVVIRNTSAPIYERTITYGNYDVVVVDIYFPSDAGGSLAVYPGGLDNKAISGDIYEIDWLYVGTGAYSTKLPDITGNGNAGTMVGVVPDTDGVSGQALYFPYSASRPYISFASNGKLKATTVGVSLSMWVKMPSVQTSYRKVVGHPTYGWHIQTYNNSLYFRMYNSSNDAQDFSASQVFVPIDDNAWMHVGFSLSYSAGTYTVTAYKNGKKLGAHSRSFTAKVETEQFLLGNNVTGPSTDFTLDEVIVASYPISDAEMLTLYQNPTVAVPAVVVAERVYARNLAAISGNLAVLSGGVDDQNNYWTLSDYSGRPSSKPVGSFRSGSQQRYIKSNPTATGSESDPIAQIEDEVSGHYIRLTSSGFKFSSALFQYISAASAFIQNLFSHMVTLSGALTAYQGEGVNRRAIRLNSSGLDFLNGDVGSEQLFARFGRLGVAGPVIIDGPVVVTNDGATWSNESVINAASSSYTAYIQLADGQLRVAYRRDSDYYLVERIWNGSSWGSESVINAAYSTYPAYIQLADGQLRVAYRRFSDYYLVERTLRRYKAPLGTSAATPEENVRRDSSGRAKVSDPLDTDDIATFGVVNDGMQLVKSDSTAATVTQVIPDCEVGQGGTLVFIRNNVGSGISTRIKLPSYGTWDWYRDLMWENGVVQPPAWGFATAGGTTITSRKSADPGTVAFRVNYKRVS